MSDTAGDYGDRERRRHCRERNTSQLGCFSPRRLSRFHNQRPPVATRNQNPTTKAYSALLWRGTPSCAKNSAVNTVRTMAEMDTNEACRIGFFTSVVGVAIVHIPCTSIPRRRCLAHAAPEQTPTVTESEVNLMPADSTFGALRRQAKLANQPEVPLRARYIPEDLLLQRFRRRKRHFIAQPQQELELEWRRFVQIYWLEIQNMRLDCE